MTRQLADLRDLALGLVSTQSFPAIVGTADMMLKSANVTLVGYEKIGSGHCTAVVRGNISDVRLAVEAGAATAREFGQELAITIIPRPYPNLDAVLPISSRLNKYSSHGGSSRLSNLAIGLLETKGFPAMVGAADAMLKSAEVYLAGYETIGAGYCTAIIRGAVADVAVAIEAGMQEADRIGEFHSLMIVPRPLEDLEATLPTASCWVDQPVRLPLHIKEAQQETVSLPAQATPEAIINKEAVKEFVE
ncbi:MAG: carbon dioxide-concentrating mechanism protein CcmK [Pseudanabaenaceae cyanobacterium]